MKFRVTLSIIGALAARAQSPGTFTPTGNLTTERFEHTGTLLTNGTVLITGGAAILSGFPTWATAETYDPAIGRFTKLTAKMMTPRRAHTATLLPNGKVLIAGGMSSFNRSSSDTLASAELYDPDTATFSPTGIMVRPRAFHTATLLNTGEVLITGGSDSYTSELYDLSTGTFRTTGDVSSAHGQRTATLLADGTVLIAGRDPGLNEIYDPATGTFSITGNSAYPLVPESANLLANGKVLVTLEYSCDPSDEAELYDPASGTFAATGKMSVGWWVDTATFLPEGKILITGTRAELYDPATGTFSRTSDMVEPWRETNAATLLPDGTVLLAGGWVCCGRTIASAELYHPNVLIPSPVLLPAPGYSQDQTHIAPGAILHASTQQLVSTDNPAVAGETLEIFCTGLVDGSVIPAQVSIGGQMAQVLYFGTAPGYANLNQINVDVPGGVTPSSSVSVRLNYLSRPSNEVTIAVQ